ncbi:YjiH family protein [Anaerosphaera multitolerans]|uniref:YjiH family protein n=1 Tax=Anaerosphaera multitolerans TaxID=2487351 RepID=A0A437S9U6_9FIRM|nr:YjiH family protein [Anaerosphaera multitolerans]RVU55614.1 YjiH family protein [Anaerosphaera multitolerans]
MDKRQKASLKFILFSLFGIFMFFISIQIGDVKTIPIDHLVKAILRIPYFMEGYGLIIVLFGTLMPFVLKTWNKSNLNKVLSILNIAGLVFVIMSMFKIGPEIITQESMGPYVLNKVVVPVVLIVPVGSVFLSFLVSYGLMECVGTFMEPIMRPVFKTPGRSAIDAVASFVGSYSLALLVTNRVYRENKYTTKEAAIIATGFSTVSATFMIITLSTLDLMEHWNMFFWTSLIITFIATAITARLYPLSRMPEDYFNPEGEIEEAEQKKLKGKELFVQAWDTGVENAMYSDSVWDNTVSNLRDGVKLALNIGPTMMSIGVISLLIAQYTGVFDILGYIFYPITALMRAPDPLLVAKASTITIADMYVPAIISTAAGIQTKFIIAVVCISEVLFFSASIPCILATDIPIKVKDIVIIWFERVVISLILVIPIAKIFF